jgi:hypothetical protein
MKDYQKEKIIGRINYNKFFGNKREVFLINYSERNEFKSMLIDIKLSFKPKVIL